ncbi:hypothetical protein KIN20_015897 [Parelaphostrongylus tenuis]|uniref:Uncharacterized protein n=1 Tax=Parelaphostrongylus tenuis TaxID=148309 RepID=A0AAD5QSS6_PARTN|nr:hypothetical protein KIN20_015897 [Parelaphostrongylus tenuis]
MEASDLLNLLRWLKTSSSGDYWTFVERANVIYECRTCASLLREAEGFMRHLTRCDSSHLDDVDPGESDRLLFDSTLDTSGVSTPAGTSPKVPSKRPPHCHVVSDANLQSSVGARRNAFVEKMLDKTQTITTLPKFGPEGVSTTMTPADLQDYGINIRPTRMRRPPKWLELDYVIWNGDAHLNKKNQV